MDDDTQQNTQPVDRPRSKGSSSHLDPKDEADILCFFHPASLPAHRAVELVRETAPQHVHSSHVKVPVSGSNVNEDTETDPRASDTDRLHPATPDRVVSADIALRMSSQVRDRRMGFVFGRSLNKCDLLMAKGSVRLSSAHFRVYVNYSGVLMLEDMSMNGTYVDHNLLKSVKGEPALLGRPSTRMLSHGSIIELPVIAQRNEEWIRFIVLFPTRKNGEDAYQSNLVDYIQWIRQDERKVELARTAGGLLPPARPMPFTPLQKTARDRSPPSATITAATGQNNYGMKWNGGETYNVVGYIGQGAFAMVYKLSTVQHGTVYACKQIEKRRFVKDGQPGHKMHHEIRIMESISHPNIVQFVDYHETSRYMFIIMEYVPLGDLTLYTNDHMMMYEHMGQHVAAQICQALKYLHEQKIAHRDIKPDNILIASHNPFAFKLSDFGLSKVVSNGYDMRTFCGTILYCAPEIYPGYERAKAGMPVGKRGRHIQHPREETQPYYYSVDTWGIAAVLFHLLSGQPAWAGTTDDNGAAMLETIFSTPIDWERLTLAGLSLLAVDFIKKMLQINPADRASDEEVLAHPWIERIVSGKRADLHAEDRTHRVANSDEEELPDASQLDINDELVPYGLDGTNEHEHSHALDDEDVVTGQEEEVWLPSRSRESLPPDMFDPQLQDARIQPQAKHRLFGEIPESALQSSGVLGQNVNEALKIADFEMEEYEEDEDDNEMERICDDEQDAEDATDEVEDDMTGTVFGSRSWMQRVFEQAADTADAACPIPEASEGGDDVGQSKFASVENDHHQSPAWTSAQSNRDTVLTPSTDNTNTEDGVENLNMVSSRSDSRKVSAQASTVASPQSTASGHKSAARRSKRSGQHLESAAQDASIKRSKTGYETSANRQPRQLSPKETQPARASRRLRNEKAEDTAETPEGKSDADEVGQDATEVEKSNREGVKSLPEEFDVSIDSSFQLHEVSKTVSRGYRIREDPDELFIACMRREKWKKAHPEQVHPGKDELYKKMIALPNPRPPPIDANSGPNLNTLIDPSSNLKPYELETPITLGVLTPTEGSFPTVATITITNRTATFGRDPKNTFVHPGDPSTANWERVGKYCIDLTFWYRNIEKEIDTKTLPTEWYKNPDLVCLISTRTTRYILINGVRLTKNSFAWDYGKLRTGDIITVVEPDPGRVPMNESETKSLSFRCEFYTGASKDPRPADGSEPFEVCDERAEFSKNQTRIVKGLFRKNFENLRASEIAKGVDFDGERAAKYENILAIRKERRKKEEEEHAAYIKHLQGRGLLNEKGELAEDPETFDPLRWEYK